MPLYLDEISLANNNFGCVVQSIPLPATTLAANALCPTCNYITGQSSQSQGGLSRNEQGNLLSFAGWNAAMSNSSAGAVGATIGYCDASGACDTSTISNNAATGGIGGDNIRKSITVDGTYFWTAGTKGFEFERRPGSSTCLNCPPGVNNTIVVSSSSANVRSARFFNGNIFVSQQENTATGIYQVGTGAPFTSSSVTQKISLPAITTLPYGFAFADGNTTLVADQNPATTSGVYVIAGLVPNGNFTIIQTITLPPVNGNIPSVSAQHLEFDNCTQTVFFTDTNKTDTAVWAATRNMATGLFGTPFILSIAPATSYYHGIAMSPSFNTSCARTSLINVPVGSCAPLPSYSAAPTSSVTSTISPSSSVSPSAGYTSSVSPSSSVSASNFYTPSPSNSPFVPVPRPFTPGNLAVLRFGPNNNYPSVGAYPSQMPIYIDEISTATTTWGTIIQTIWLPYTAALASSLCPLCNVITGQKSQSQGGLSRSENKQFLSFMGWQAPISNAAAATNNPFTIAFCNASGICDTSTTSLGASIGLGGNNARSSVTVDGTQFWSCGTNGLEMEYRPNTPNCPGAGPCNTLIFSSLAANPRSMRIFNNNLYFDQQLTPDGLYRFDGLPTAESPVPPENLQDGIGSSFAFAFPDNNTLLVADQTSTNVSVAAGVSVYKGNVLTDGPYTLQQIITNPTVGNRAQHLEYDSCSGTIYFTDDTATVTTQTKIWASTRGSNGVWTAATLLAQAPANSQFKGVAMVPVVNPNVCTWASVSPTASVSRSISPSASPSPSVIPTPGVQTMGSFPSALTPGSIVALRMGKSDGSSPDDRTGLVAGTNNIIGTTYAAEYLTNGTLLQEIDLGTLNPPCRMSYCML
jgi:hypothetical protein